MGLAGGDRGAASDVAFYAANHVLVKAALFLDRRRRRDARRAAPVAGADRGGGARAEPRRTAADRRRAGQARRQGRLRRRPGQWGSQASAAATHGSDAAFRHAARAIARERGVRRRRPSASGRGSRSPLASMLVPWLMFPAVGGDLAECARARRRCGTRSGRCSSARRWPPGYGPWANRSRAFPPATSSWRRRPPSARARLLSALRSSGLTGGSRQWPAAGLSLLTIALALAAAGFASR